MAEQKKTAKKTVKKTTTRPKVKPTIKEEALEAQETVQEEVKKETRPTRKKRPNIDRDERIACRSATKGELIYISKKTGFDYVWHDFGAVEYIEMGELMTMRSSSPAFLNDGYLIIDDEDAASYLGLDKVYENLFYLDDLDEFFELPLAEFQQTLSKLPKGIQSTVATYARELIENGKLDSRAKIRSLENELKIDLSIFEK